MSSSGQSVTDRLNAAKHSLTGQGLAKAVCKSTTEEVSGPKRKHLDYLLQCTHETNVSVPQMADLLIQRTQTANWVVVFKSLITVHNVMNYGSERYMQYMASNTVFSNLDSFNDRSTPQGYDMSTYIRKYAKYINEKAVAYRLMAFDFCKVKRGKEDGLLRTMAPEKLLKALPVLQAQIDALLEFDPSLNELNNGVINAAFLLLFKDLIRLFACYNDGIINLLEKFFEMNRKQCKEALDIYKKFLVRMDQTGEFLKVAEPWSKKQNVGIDKGDIPDLTKAPASLLEALEAHLKSLEGKKASKLQASAQKAGGTGLSEEEKKKILAEEEKELQRMKSPGGKPEKAKKKKKRERKEKAQSHSAQMESASQVPAQQTTQVIAPQPAATAAAPAPSASDDLLALDVSPFQAKANNVMSVANSSNQQWAQNPLDPMSLSPAPAQPTPGAFTSETGFASAFGTTQQSPMPGMFLQPSTAPLAPTVSNHQESKADLLDLDIGATVSESPVEAAAPTADEPSANDVADNAEESTPAAVAAEVDEEEVNEEAGAAVEAMPDLLSSNDNLLCVSIGGQSITINTKPSSVTASANASPDSTPHASPQPVQKSPHDEASSEEKEPENVAVMDLLADFSAPAEEPATNAAVDMNSDIMDLLGGLEVAEPAPLTLQGSIDVVTAECSLPQPAVMLLPTAERCITPSPSIVNPNQAVEKEESTSPQPTEEINGENEVEPSPALPDVAVTASPKPTPKMAAKPAPVPSNPLEAAMFKQLFPEQPKVVAKKSLLEMQAETGSKSASVSPALTRRDSRTDGESGQLLMPQKKEDQTPADSKLVKKDLESSLASLTESKLVMTPGSMNKGNHQWGPEQPKKMTGGQNFQQVGQPAAAGAATTWMTQQQPVNPLMGQPPAGFNMQPSQQFFVNPAAPQLYPANFAANPYATNMAPPMYQPRPQQPMMPQQQQMMQPMQPQSTNNPDLFGL